MKLKEFPVRSIESINVTYNKMPYSVVSVKLTDGQVKKLKSKSAKECGTTITLKPAQMSVGTHNISLTDRQIKQFDDVLKNK